MTTYGRDSKLRPPEYEAGMLTSTPKQSDVFSTVLSQSTCRDIRRLPETENKCRTNSLFRRWQSLSQTRSSPPLVSSTGSLPRSQPITFLYPIPGDSTPHTHTPSHTNALRFTLISSSYHRLGYQLGKIHLYNKGKGKCEYTWRNS